MHAESLNITFFKNKLNWTLFGILVLSCWYHIVLFFLAYDLSVPSDTNSFLELLAMVKGDLPEKYAIPFRIDNPLYSLTILVINIFVEDWLLAAKIAALIPSIFTPVVFGFIARSIDKSILSVFFAGILGIFSIPLSTIGLYPLSDSLFILCSSLTLLSTLRFISNKTLINAICVGMFAGISWATRGPGLFYIIVISIPIIFWYIQIKHQTYETGNSKFFFKLLFVILFTFVAFGKLSTCYFSLYSEDRVSNESYLKSAIIGGSLYAKGMSFYNTKAYTLNDNATGFIASGDMSDLSWIEIAGKYGKTQMQAFFINLHRNFNEIIPDVLAPFFLIFFPFAVGVIYMWNRNRIDEILVLFLMLFPYLFIIPAIQLHPRYIYPIACVCLPLAGVGLKNIYFNTGVESTNKLLFRKLLSVIMVVLYISLSSFETLNNINPADWPKLYKSAAVWIENKHGDELNFSVMSRYHGVFTYLNGKTSKTSMPVDSIERVANYCRYSNTRYLFMGPMEFDHNPQLKELIRDEPTHVDDITFSLAEIFTTGDYVLALIRVDWPNDVN